MLGLFPQFIFCALFAYAAGFSFAYVSLPTATGALLLFGAVQATMIGYGLWSGERLRRLQVIGLLLALAGLVGLLLPGLAAPPLWGSVLMLGAGVAWGIYSLRGRGSGDSTRVTAGNFLRAVPITLLMSAEPTFGLGFGCHSGRRGFGDPATKGHHSYLIRIILGRFDLF